MSYAPGPHQSGEPGEATATKLYNQYNEQLRKGNVTAKQAAAAAVLLTADTLAEEWIFCDQVKLGVQDIEKYLKSKEAVDNGVRAHNIMSTWIEQNEHRFVKNTRNPPQNFVGRIRHSKDVVQICVLKTEFDDVMRANGFNGSEYMSWLKREEILVCANDGKTTQRIRMDDDRSSTPLTCVVFRADKLVNWKKEDE